MKHSATTGTDRLVMLAIAEQCRAEEPSSEGKWESYPGVHRIALYAGLRNDRTAQTAITRLVDRSLLEKNDGPQSIRADRRPNTYRIPTSTGVKCGLDDCHVCLFYGVRPESPRKAPRGALRQHTGCATSTHGVTHDAPRGAPGVTRTLENPVEPSEPSRVSTEKRERPSVDFVIAKFSHLGRSHVWQKLEVFGYDDDEIRDALVIYDESRKQLTA